MDTRFLVEYFYSADPEMKRKVSKRLRELLQRREGVLPTIVIGEIVHIVCERVGREEARHVTLLL